MSGRKGSKKMTPEAYKQTKVLLEVGLKPRQITEITGRSFGTVGRVKTSKDYADYVEVGRAYRASSQARLAVDAPAAEAQPQPKEDFSLVLSKLTNIENCLNTLLEVIKDKEARANTSFWKR